MLPAIVPPVDIIVLLAIIRSVGDLCEAVRVIFLHKGSTGALWIIHVVCIVANVNLIVLKIVFLISVVILIKAAIYVLNN